MRPAQRGSSMPVRALYAAHSGYRLMLASLPSMFGTNSASHTQARTSHGIQCPATTANDA